VVFCCKQFEDPNKESSFPLSVGSSRDQLINWWAVPGETPRCVLRLVAKFCGAPLASFLLEEAGGQQEYQSPGSG